MTIHRMTISTRLVVCLLATAGLSTACGGRSSSSPAEASVVPEAAMASGNTMVDFIKTLMADEDSEPLRMNGVEPPASEVDEPLPAA
jgi:hypothetical protein